MESNGEGDSQTIASTMPVEIVLTPEILSMPHPLLAPPKVSSLPSSTNAHSGSSKRGKAFGVGKGGKDGKDNSDGDAPEIIGKKLQEFFQSSLKTVHTELEERGISSSPMTAGLVGGGGGSISVASSPSLASLVPPKPKRRKGCDLAEHEKWYCPYRCGKFYRKTSTRSIRRHRNECAFQLSVPPGLPSSSPALSATSNITSPALIPGSPASMRANNSNSAVYKRNGYGSHHPPLPSPLLSSSSHQRQQQQQLRRQRSGSAVESSNGSVYSSQLPRLSPALPSASSVAGLTSTLALNGSSRKGVVSSPSPPPSLAGSARVSVIVARGGVGVGTGGGGAGEDDNGEMNKAKGRYVRHNSTSSSSSSSSSSSQTNGVGSSGGTVKRRRRRRKKITEDNTETNNVFLLKSLQEPLARGGGAGDDDDDDAALNGDVLNNGAGSCDNQKSRLSKKCRALAKKLEKCVDEGEGHGQQRQRQQQQQRRDGKLKMLATAPGISKTHDCEQEGDKEAEGEEEEEEEEEEGRKSWALHANGVASAPSSSEKKRKLLRKARQQRRHSWRFEHQGVGSFVRSITSKHAKGHESAETDYQTLFNTLTCQIDITEAGSAILAFPVKCTRETFAHVHKSKDVWPMLPHEQLLKILEKENKCENHLPQPKKQKKEDTRTPLGRIEVSKAKTPMILPLELSAWKQSTLRVIVFERSHVDSRDMPQRLLPRGASEYNPPSHNTPCRLAADAKLKRRHHHLSTLVIATC
eukprot:jgi/Bigna1/76013/fgenesh1_pg.38_\